MDGFETTRRIRSKKGNYFKEVPIIAMTASTSESTREEIFKSGMQDLVSKPISADDLRSRMIQHIKLVDHSVEEEETEIVWDEAIQGDSGTKVNFERTDKLFLENVVRYQEFLRMSIEELSINRDLLLTAIAEEDLVVFRKINHRMKNLLGTLALHDLLEHLEKTKQKIADDQLSKKVRREMAKSLRQHIEDVIDIMSHKQASLKWQ
jgi:CheY-like chemotaxis protein